MLRIRTGARDGLRWGLFGFVAAVLTLSADPINAAPYADIVVDANSGAVLHATNPDARRHPASLTKIMTLYLLFERLDAGKLKLDTPLKVSAEASGQSPTKLGLKPGSTLAVEDAIKGMVTRSANDAAVVVAEAIAGSEDDFARLMTRKAQALGMTNSVYKNASGLPDDNQVTTARDQSTLGRAIQERFPRYYKYFSIRTFTFRGESISNHNHLLGKVEGVDGIKTGFINASGFNLVTSVHRGNRYLVAVVMGGSSGGSRDARMRELITEKIALASIKRTAPMVAEASGTPDVRPEPMVVTKAEAKPAQEAKPAPMAVAKAEPKSESKSEPKPEPMVVTKAEPKVAAAKVEPKEAPKAEAKAEPRFVVASATSLPVRFNSATPPAEPAALRSEPAAAAMLTQTQVPAGSTEPIRPVLVKTLTVKAGVRTASLATSQVALPAPEAQPIAAPAPAPMPAAKAEPAAPPPAPIAAEPPTPPTPPPAPVAAAKPEPAAVAPEGAMKPEPAAAPAAATIAAKEEPAAAPPIAAVAAVAAKPEPAAEPAAVHPGASSAPPAPVAAAAPVVPTPKPAPAAKVAAATSTAKPAPAAPTAKPQHRPGWMIQVGAFPAEQAAQQRLSTVQSKASKMLSGAEAFTETVDKAGTTFYRARFAGLDKDKAEAACKYLKKNDVECVTVKN
jgi:D-alanyl-D-alanine carboxypeptidase